MQSETKGSMSLKKPTAVSEPVITVSSDLAHELLGMNPKELLQSIKNIPLGDYAAKVQFTINKRSLLLQSSNVNWHFARVLTKKMSMLS
jgi:hypothetical protein